MLCSAIMSMLQGPDSRRKCWLSFCYSTAVFVTNNGATLTDSASNEIYAKISLEYVFLQTLKPHEGWSPNTTSLLLDHNFFFSSYFIYLLLKHSSRI